MSEIEVGIINFLQVFPGDLFDVYFDIEDIDISGMKLKMEFRADPDSDPVVTFQESDGSLSKIVYSNILTTVHLLKNGDEMLIPVLSESSPENRYLGTLIMYSTVDDVLTIGKSYMEVVDQYTKVTP
jgi:hypothetical protein